MKLHFGGYLVLAAAWLAVALAVSGAGKETPNDSPKTIVVLVPGITGSKLRDRETGEVVWGDGINVVAPRDGGYSLARPLLPKGPPRLEAFEVISRLRLALVIRKEIYGPILRLMEESGYQLGRLDDPLPGDDFFPFPYDWRQDMAATARGLFRKLEKLAPEMLNRIPLRVNLICQSTGGQVCRYLVKYGESSLAEAENGLRSVPEGIEIGKVILVGTANGGSLRTLRELNRGRSYLGRIGRKWEPETLFTFPALYQDLPSYHEDLFIDADGTALDVDLYDAASWERYGWSVFDSDVEQRLAERDRPDLFADRVSRRGFLTRMLSDAHRFQRLLERDVEGSSPAAYYSIQNNAAATPHRAVLMRADGRWRTLFSGDQEMSRLRLDSLTTAGGDEHATVASQKWLSATEKQRLARPTLYVEGGHFDLILNPIAKSRLIGFLKEDADRR